jgi:hypothetical protein
MRLIAVTPPAMEASWFHLRNLTFMMFRIFHLLHLAGPARARTGCLTRRVRLLHVIQLQKWALAVSLVSCVNGNMWDLGFWAIALNFFVPSLVMRMRGSEVEFVEQELDGVKMEE